MTTPLGGFALADAFVRIRPDSAGFRAEATSQIKAATSGIRPSIKITADTNAAKASVAAFNAYARTVLRGEEVKVSAETAQAKEEVASLAAILSSLAKRVYETRLKVTDPGVQAKLGLIMGQLRAIERTFEATVTLEGAEQIQTRLLGLESQFGRIRRDLDSGVTPALNRARNAWYGWAVLVNRVPLFGGKTFFGLLGGTIALWHLLADAIIETIAVLVPAGIAFGAFALAAGDAVTSVLNHLKAVDTVMEATGQAVGPFSNAFEKLAAAVRPRVYELFGQLMQVVNSRMGAFSQLAQQAGTVLGAFGARIEQAIVSSGFQRFLHNAISDLTTVGDIIGNVFGILGNLIRTVSGVAGVLFHAILDITGAIERLTGTALFQWLGHAAILMHGFWIWTGLAATAILKLVPLIARLLGVMSETTAAATGFARIRGATRDLGNAVSGLLPWFRNLIPNLRNWVSGLAKAGGAAEGAGRGTKLFAAAMGLLTKIPAPAWIAGAVVGLVGLAYWMDQTKSAAQQTLDAIQSNLEHTVTWGNVTTAAATALARADAAQRRFTTSINVSGPAVAKQTQFIGSAYAAQEKLTQSQRDYTAGQARFDDQSKLVAFRLGEITNRYGGLGQAIGLARLAGIKIQDVVNANTRAWKLDLEQIDGLIQGYKYMGVQSGALGNAVKAVQLVADAQIGAVNNLNQAWTQFLGIVSGGETTFVTFAQDMLSANKALAQTGGTPRTVTATFQAATTGAQRASASARAASTSFSGLNAQSLQLRSTWLSSIQAAQQYYEALQTQSAAASDASRGEALLHQAGADLIRILAPAARGSSTLRQAVYALAQQFRFTRSQMVQLINHSGSLKKNEEDLQKVNIRLAKSVSDVGKDWAAMATTLQGQVKQALDSVALSSSGTKTAAQNLFEAIHASHPDLATEHQRLETLITDLHSSGLSWSQARDYAEAFTKGLHANWQEILTGSAPRKTLQADTASQISLYKNVANLVATYSGALQKNASQTAAGRAQRLQLVADLNAAGIKAGLSTTAIDKMIASILKIPKSEALRLIMQATGQFTISQVESLSRPGGKLSGPQGRAAGGRIPGYGGGDRFPAMLEGGETVVPKHLTPLVAPLMAAHGVPGFASGGFIGNGTYPVVAPQLANFYQISASTFQKKFTNAMVTDTRNALATAMKAAQSQLSDFGGHGVIPRGPIQDYARKLVGAVWPGLGEWLAFADIVARESGWNTYATNPSSGAYGIPQALPPGKMASAGADWRTNPFTQIRWMVGYIRGRWGDPIRADFNERNAHWYDNGGWLPAGLSLAFNGTGRPEPVGAAAGMNLNITIKVDPVIASVTPDRRLGQQIAQHLTYAIKAGTQLFPPGVTIGRVTGSGAQPIVRTV